MQQDPSKFAERIVALFIPSACREEVLGDLHERYLSPARYLWDAAQTVPQIIFSRIRRTASPQMILVQALAFHTSFLVSAWLNGGNLLRDDLGLATLAIPGMVATAGVMLKDAYTARGQQSYFRLTQSPFFGLGLAVVSQAWLSISQSNLAIPRFIMLNGCAMSLIASCAVRILFSQSADRMQRAAGPAQEQIGYEDSPLAWPFFVKCVCMLGAVLIVGDLATTYYNLPKHFAGAAIVLLTLYIIWKSKGEIS